MSLQDRPASTAVQLRRKKSSSPLTASAPAKGGDKAEPHEWTLITVNYEMAQAKALLASAVESARRQAADELEHSRALLEERQAARDIAEMNPRCSRDVAEM